MPETLKNISQVNLKHRCEGIVFGDVLYHVGGECGPRQQGDFQLVLLHSGSVRISIDERVEVLDPGQGLLLHPGAREYFQFSPQTPSRHSWCSIHPDWVAPEIEQLLKKTTSPLAFSLRDRSLMELGLKESTASPNAAASNYYYSQLALTLLLGFIQSGRESRPADRHRELFEAVVEFISNEYNRSLQLADLAQAAGISPQHLLRIFRQLEQPTPMEFLYRYRLQRAQDLLSQTGLSISDISQQCGFENPYHFSRRFHKTIGLSPRSFRQKIWQ